MFSLLIRVFILAMSTIAELLSIVVALPPAIRAFVLSIRYRPPGLGMSEDQNQTDTYKKRTGATGGRPLDASRGLKYHDTPSTGLRDLVSSPDAFGNVARGDPLPYKLSDRALRLAGLTPETFRLHVRPRGRQGRSRQRMDERMKERETICGGGGAEACMRDFPQGHHCSANVAALSWSDPCE